MLRPSDRYRPTISGHNIYQQRKPRQPHGPNAIQPIANSGQPGTAGFTPPKQVSQPYTGVANPAAQSTQMANSQGASNVPDYYGMGQAPKPAAPPMSTQDFFNHNYHTGFQRANQQMAAENAGLGGQQYYKGVQAAGDAMGAKADRIDEANKRLQESSASLDPYYQTYGNVRGYEIGKQAQQYQAMASAEQAKQAAFNAQYNANWDAYKAAQRGNRAAMEKELGVQDAQSTTNDLSKLSGEFANFQKTRTGMKFVDFIQAKINKGEIPYGSDMLKVIANNYGHTFQPPQPSVAGDSAIDSIYDSGKQAVVDAREQAAIDRLYGYKPGMSAAQRDGLDRRRAQAAKQATDSSEIAYNVAHGIDPYTARQMVAADNAKQDYYGQQRALKQDEYDAQLQAEAMRAQADIYRADKQFEATKAKQDPYQSTPDSQLANEIKKAGDIDLSSVTAPASIVARANAAGLSPAETLTTMSKTFGVDLSHQDNARDLARNIIEDIRGRVAATQSDDAWQTGEGFSMNKLDEEAKRQAALQVPVLRALLSVVPAQELAAMLTGGADDRVDLRFIIPMLQ